MNYDLIFALIFYALLVLFFFKHRSKFEVQGKIFALYKTKIGLRLMDKLANWCPSFWRFFGIISIITGFAGMVVIVIFLIKGTWDLIFVPNALPAVAPVLPGIKVMPGLPVLSFWHWIIAIFVVAVIHEFCHGIWARVYNIKIKSSGFAFLGPILAAFVEPDEKVMNKRPRYQQLAVFSAGPFSNVIMGVIFLLIINFVTGPFNNSLYEGEGVEVATVVDNFPADKSGIETPFIITGVNDNETLTVGAFVQATNDVSPGDVIKLRTDKGEYALVTVKNPDNASKAFIGIAGLSQKQKLKQESIDKYGDFFPKFFSWFSLLTLWLAVVSVGIGLFNLLPLGPIDGGRMFLTGMLVVTKGNKERSKRIWSFFSLLCLILIFVNLLPFFWKVLVFLVKPLLSLAGV